jgi:hypothetical protein
VQVSFTRWQQHLQSIGSISAGPAIQILTRQKSSPGIRDSDTDHRDQHTFGCSAGIMCNRGH